MASYKENPKTKGSGIICGIPQTGTCLNKCEDCFFQSGRSFLEPLSKNLPNMPAPIFMGHRILRLNDGNDSNVHRETVEKEAQKYSHYFFNTAVPRKLREFGMPVVFTANPADRTDSNPILLKEIPENLMFVRLRTNTWNLEGAIIPAVKHYTKNNVPVVLTYMAYYTETVKEPENYEWKKRTLNSYWVLKSESRKR